jgi:hypothetical protein
VGRVIKILVAIVAVLAVSKGVQYVMVGDDRTNARKALTKAANDANAQLPKKMDDVITMTQVDFDGKIWRMHYSVDPRTTLDVASKDKFQQLALAQVCGGESKRILKQNITIEFVYHHTDSNGAQRMTLSLPPNSCA